MDKYDQLILRIIHSKGRITEQKEKITLHHLEHKFWKSIEDDKNLTLKHGRIGERITQLYIKGLIENKQGYMLTRKGRRELIN